MDTEEPAQEAAEEPEVALAEKRAEAAPAKAKKAKAPETLITREPGKSVLPFSRVQKILKADKVRVPSAIWERALTWGNGCRICAWYSARLRFSSRWRRRTSSRGLRRRFSGVRGGRGARRCRGRMLVRYVPLLFMRWHVVEWRVF